MKHLLITGLSLALCMNPVFAKDVNIEYKGNFDECINEPLSIQLDELRVPGDLVEESIIFTNLLEKDVELYMEMNGSGVYESMIVSCYKNEERLFKKEMNELSDLKESLGTYTKDEICRLKFILEVPASLDNEYEYATGKVDITLGVKQDEDLPVVGIISNHIYAISACLFASLYMINKRGKKHEEN